MMKKYQYCLLFIFIIFATNLRAQLPPAAQEALDKGIIAAKLPDYPLAIRYFEDARKIAPDASITYFYLGLAESKIPGRELRAICWFSAFLAADPKSEKAASVKEELQKLEIVSQSNVSRLIKTLQSSPILTDNSSVERKISNERTIMAIAELWAMSGDFATALKVVATSPSYEGQNTLIHIAKIQTTDGDVTGALKTVEKLEKPNDRIDVYLSMAEILVKSGDPINAEKLFVLARQTADLVTDRGGSWWYRLRSIGRAQLEAGNKAGAREPYKAALSVVESLTDIKEKTNAQRVLGCEQISIGDIEAAKQTLLIAFKNSELISEPYSRAVNQYDIAVCQAESGDLGNALKTYNALLNSFNQISNAEQKKPFTETYFRLAKQSIAKAQIKAGDFVPALKWANEITEQEEKASVLRDIAWAQAKRGNFVGALQTANQINNQEKKSSALAIVSQLQADSRDYDSATKTAEMIPKDETKNYAIKYLAKRKAIDIVEDKAKTGDFSGIVKMIDDIPDPKEKSIQLYTFAREFAESHNFDLASKAGEMIQDAKWKGLATTKIAEERAKATSTPYTPPSTIIKPPPPLTATEWIKKVNDLEANYFLDLPEYLKTLPADNANRMFNELYNSVSKMVEQQNFIINALKRKPTEQPK